LFSKQSFTLSSTQQWYCLEAAETGDELLAVGRLTLPELETQPIRIDLVRFSPLSSSVCNKEQVSAQQFFIQKLIYVSHQLSETASGLELLLNIYDEAFVNVLVSLGWQEKGGYFSTESNSMVHEFVFGPLSFSVEEEEVVSTNNTLGELDFEVIDDGLPSNGMKDLMESLFSALHKEEGDGKGTNS